MNHGTVRGSAMGTMEQYEDLQWEPWNSTRICNGNHGTVRGSAMGQLENSLHDRTLPVRIRQLHPTINSPPPPAALTRTQTRTQTRPHPSEVHTQTGTTVCSHQTNRFSDNSIRGDQWSNQPKQRCADRRRESRGMPGSNRKRRHPFH
jgi:hypothetical protein